MRGSPAHDAHGVSRSGDGSGHLPARGARWAGAALRSTVSALIVSASCSSCAAVYPELQTPLRPAAAGVTLAPPPPADLKYIELVEGDAPSTTVDGRPWHELGNKLPNPFAIFYVNGRAIIKTDPQTGTLKPTWPGSPRGNFRIGKQDRIRIEMWESSLTQRPICVKDLGAVDGDELLADKQIVVKCDNDARIVVTFEPARAQVGYGFFFEFRTYSTYVSRVYQEGPAARAGLRRGDKIAAVGGRVTQGMDQKVVQSYLNASRMDGIVVDVIHADGKQETLTIKEGPVYQMYQENQVIDR